MEIPEHRTVAIQLYNECWTLLDRMDRTVDDDAELLSDAFASRFHWRVAGQLQQWIISDWMVARAASATGFGDLAVEFAARAVEASSAPGLPDWLVASGAEGLARAYLAAGDLEACDQWIERASELVAVIGNQEERALIAEQLASIPR